MTEDRGGARGKEEPSVVIEVERLSTEEGSQVRGGSRMRMREPGGATRLRVSGGAEVGGSQCRGAERSTD